MFTSWKKVPNFILEALPFPLKKEQSGIQMQMCLSMPFVMHCWALQGFAI